MFITFGVTDQTSRAIGLFGSVKSIHVTYTHKRKSNEFRPTERAGHSLEPPIWKYSVAVLWDIDLVKDGEASY